MNHFTPGTSVAMTSFGLKLMSEMRSPATLIDHARTAEDRGMDFVSISDHIHPWVPEHDHASFAWSVLGGVATATERIDIITGVTCPIIRYHPVIIAQAAGTIGVMSEGRFILGLGAGERLNEHVTGAEFPAVDIRHEMLDEAITIMRELWKGEFMIHRGQHFQADRVKVYDTPADPVPIVLAVSGPSSLDLAARHECAGIMATEPDADLVDGWSQRGGDSARPGPRCPSPGSRPRRRASKQPACSDSEFRVGMSPPNCRTLPTSQQPRV